MAARVTWGRRRGPRNNFSSSSRGTPVVGEGSGEERDSEQSAATESDPAPADLDEKRFKRLVAYKAGQQAKADGAKWGEFLFRDAQMAAAWEAGWLGERMPEFGED